MHNDIATYMKQSEEKAIPVKICESQWQPIEHLAKLRENEIDKEDGIVDAVVVMHELGIGKDTLANYISSGKISADMYYESPVNGKKKFKLDKILGIEKTNGTKKQINEAI